MIRHIVMWRMRGDTPAERATASHRVKASFEGLRGLIPGMKYIEVGLDSSKVDYACDVVLVSEFESTEALEAYTSHPEHLRVRKELGDLRTARFQVDYAIEASGNTEQIRECAHAKA
ncbi:Dabb family protein [Paraburkholderia sp. BL17N1]|uniref:Dabb family protein n=1 Tax=Paraburkholderia sp. BL17N1 TaxID=1938798 RepID=UPI000F2C4AFB|nr:Dabb family protein [Paraburkholderia sp. BL17N1]RKR36175.1 stress responsive alpha/beta barrel protein [Paraburkholderia sp. BL17N1]